MESTHHETEICPVCGLERPEDEMLPGALLQGALVDLVERRHPDWTPEHRLCHSCLSDLRAEYVEDVLEASHGELTALEEDVVESLKEHEILTRDVNAEFERVLTLGERIADRVADVGGSWVFIGTFFAVLVVWITVNSHLLVHRPFDPYPFILLNLVLSCLAAIQAPVIMMSQNRQEAKDRLRSEHDYRINLKAELEIRHLNSKMDQLLTHQWQRLLEIQRIQTQLMDEIVRRGQPDSAK
jgi:uncharacterized membrane protein